MDLFTSQSKSIYENADNWRDDTVNSFPKDVLCPICRNGKFQLSLSGAVANGACDCCQTSVPFRFYDSEYNYLKELAEKCGAEKDALGEPEFFDLLQDYARAVKFSERIKAHKQIQNYVRKHFERK
jgi:hypothetical protein